ncbi:head maturation protease, ClpP-related [Pleomorphochaeta sp. DL1XJH-081]|uniref:head maturation protease, ClpP-related n=1 Tax=Pleomorphochaeta sp. DL1XJH-081 TaxID=3409690 RepID=UPI003BB59663
MKNKKFWQWKNQSEDEGRARILELSGTIAEESWFDDDITPEQFRSELFADSGEVTVWINSPGGDCIAASRIYAMLMDYPGAITVKIDGIAASAASVIAMAGTKVLMAPTALMMIHNPMTLAYGNHQDMQKAIGMLDEVKESIVNAYEIKTNLTRAKISHLMDNETWMNAKKAIELGFADAILEDAKKVSNGVSYAFSTRTSQLSLLNKITETYAITEDQEPPEQGRAALGELEKRLNLIKPQ